MLKEMEKCLEERKLEINIGKTKIVRFGEGRGKRKWHGAGRGEGLKRLKNINI